MSNSDGQGRVEVQTRQFGLFNFTKILPPKELRKILGAFSAEVHSCIASGNDDLRDLFEVVVSRKMQSMAAETVQSIRDIGSKTNAEIEEILQAETAKLAAAVAERAERFDEMFGDIQAHIVDIQSQIPDLRFLPDELRAYLTSAQESLESRLLSSVTAIESKIDQAAERINAHTTQTVHSALTEQQVQRLKSLKNRLRSEVNADNIELGEIKDLCYDILAITDDDCMARFYLAASRKDLKKLRDFIASIDVDRDYENIEPIVKYAVDRLDIDIITLKALETLITVAYEHRDTGKYGKWTEIIGREKINLDNDIYDPFKERDCFIAHSGTQLDVAERLAEYLHDNGLECFLAKHNLKHYTRDDYETKIRIAIEHCRVFILISSDVSRQTPDIRNIEIKHVMDIDYGNAPAEYRAQRNYAGIPYELKRPRLEYIIEPYRSRVYEQNINDFFRGYNNKVYVDNADPQAAMRAVAEYIWTIKDGKDRNRTEPPKRVDVPRTDVPSVKVQADVQPEIVVKNDSGAHGAEIRQTPQFDDPPEPQYTVKGHDYPTLENYDRSLFEIKGTELAKYIGGGGTVKIPIGVKSIGNYAFSGRNNITFVELPSTVTAIGSCAFDKCVDLVGIEIPDSVRNIGWFAFRGCCRLKSVYIPKNVESIGNAAFSGCSGIVSMKVSCSNAKYRSSGNCIIDIAEGVVFAGCKNSVIPNDGSVSAVGEGAFFGCDSLTEIVIPSNITCIAEGAFRNCCALTDITIPDTVNVIRSKTFWDCVNLKRVTMPERFKATRKKIFGERYGAIAFKFI